MELAKITSKGQITIPREVRKKLGVKEGDKVLFLEEKGRIILMNSAMAALQTVQDAFTGAAQEAGLKNEQDVVDMIKALRREE